MSSHWPVAPWRSFSGRGEIRVSAARVPSMAEGQIIASVSGSFEDQPFSASLSALATSKSDPVWAHHSPRSRPMAVAMAGSSTTFRRSLIPASGCWFAAEAVFSAFDFASSQPANGRTAKKKATRIAARRFAGRWCGDMGFTTSRRAEGSPIVGIGCPLRRPLHRPLSPWRNLP